MADPRQDLTSGGDPERETPPASVADRVLLAVFGVSGLSTAILGYLGWKRARPVEPPRRPEVPAPPSSGVARSVETLEVEQELAEEDAAEEEIIHPDGRIEHPAVRYEPSILQFRWVIGIMVVVICFAVFHYYAVWRYLWWREGAAEKAKSSPFPLGPVQSEELPGGPRLEQIDRLARTGQPNAYVVEAPKEEVLHSYGQTEEKGYVRIPIEEAIKSLPELQPDLFPARKKPFERGPAKDRGLVDGGESNAGRMFRGGSR